MTTRRAARAAAAAPASGLVPEAMRDPAAPLWQDPEAVATAFPEYVHPADVLDPMAGRLLYSRTTARWAGANGFASERCPRLPDLERFRAACEAGE